MGMLTDDDLRHLMGEAAASYEVPDDGPEQVLEAVESRPARLRALDGEGDRPAHPAARRVILVSAAASVVALAVLAGLVIGGRGSGGAGDSTVVAASQAAGPESAPKSLSDGQAYNPAAGTLDTRDGASGSYSDQTAADSGALPPVTAPARVAFTAASSGGTALAPAAPATGAAGAPGTVGGKGAPPVAAPIADGARVIKKGSVALLVADGKVTPTLTAVGELAAQAGGEVATSSTQEFGPNPAGSVTLRFPSDKFESVVAAVRNLAEVRAATTTGQDVTAQYSDVETQVKTLQAARERFLVILSNAKSVGDILAVQQRVDDTTAKIDRLEGQRRVLADQSDKATLEVTVTQKDDPVVTRVDKPDNGLTKAFKDAGSGFTGGVEALVRNSGRAVLLVLCLAVTLVVLRLGWRIGRRRLV